MEKGRGSQEKRLAVGLRPCRHLVPVDCISSRQHDHFPDVWLRWVVGISFPFCGVTVSSILRLVPCNPSSHFSFVDDRLGDGKEYLKADYTIQVMHYLPAVIFFESTCAAVKSLLH